MPPLLWTGRPPSAVAPLSERVGEGGKGRERKEGEERVGEREKERGGGRIGGEQKEGEWRERRGKKRKVNCYRENGTHWYT